MSKVRKASSHRHPARSHTASTPPTTKQGKPEPTSAQRSTPKRGRVILLAFGIAVALFLATLPWQRRQWAQVAQARQAATLHETRAKEIAGIHQQLAAAEEQVRRDPEDVEARLAASRILADRRDIPRAAAHLSAIEPAARRSPELASALASLYQKIGYLDRALAMARLEQRLAPDSASALLNLGFVYQQLGWRKQVEPLFRRAVQIDPESAEPHLALAMWYSETADDRAAAAKELAIADRLRPGDWRIAVLIAQNLQAQRRYEDALKAVEKGLGYSPDEPQLHTQKASILLDQAGIRTGAGPADFEPAKRAAEQALSLNPDDPEAMFILGTIHRRVGNEAAAIEKWEQLLKINPEYPRLRLNLGQLLVRRGDRAHGQQMLAEARRVQAEATEFNQLVIRAGMDPENIALRRDLARWCMRHDRLSRAILEWQEILSRRPNDSEALQQLRAALARRDSSQ